jgi:hypothetical protein
MQTFTEEVFLGQETLDIKAKLCAAPAGKSVRVGGTLVE